MEWISDITISQTDPFAPIETLPYYNSFETLDDWLFSPAFRLEAGKVYRLAVGALASSEAYAEKFEVKMGTAADSDEMTTEVIGETIVDWEEVPQTIENRFITVDDTDVYYFGIHAISPEDCASLRIDDFLVEETILTVPAAATDLTVTARVSPPRRSACA
jgi:hypothetical protein